MYTSRHVIFDSFMTCRPCPPKNPSCRPKHPKTQFIPCRESPTIFSLATQCSSFPYALSANALVPDVCKGVATIDATSSSTLSNPISSPSPHIVHDLGQTLSNLNNPHTTCTDYTCSSRSLSRNSSIP